jgi:hypothetical protein
MMGSGLMVIALVGALGLLGMGMAGRRVRPGRARVRPAPPGWLREPPLRPEEAERRSRELLQSVVNPDEWEMFRDLGFICVTGGRQAARGGAVEGPPRHRYLIYPHLPVVALLPRSMAPVREYCVRFPDRRARGGEPALPAGDDVLAKWMTLRADEARLLSFANVAGPGCQVPLARVERDLARLERWRARRAIPDQNGGGGS